MCQLNWNTSAYRGTRWEDNSNIEVYRGVPGKASMSEVGQSRPNWAVVVMCGLPSVATVGADILVRQLRASSGLWAQGPFYGIVVEKAEHRMMEEL